MKHVWKWVILCLTMTVLLMGCGGGSPLDGIWTGNIFGSKITFAFSNDFCFLIFEEYDAEYVNYTYNTKDGILDLDGLEIPVTIKGDTLTFSIEGTSAELVREKTAKAPGNVSGGWNGPDGMVLAFINDKVYFLDEDHDADYGAYTINGADGSINSIIYHYELNFTVKGNTLTIPDEDFIFTRIK